MPIKCRCVVILRRAASRQTLGAKTAGRLYFLFASLPKIAGGRRFLPPSLLAPATSPFAALTCGKRERISIVPCREVIIKYTFASSSVSSMALWEVRAALLTPKCSQSASKECPRMFGLFARDHFSEQVTAAAIFSSGCPSVFANSLLRKTHVKIRVVNDDFVAAQKIGEVRGDGGEFRLVGQKRVVEFVNVKRLFFHFPLRVEISMKHAAFLARDGDAIVVGDGGDFDNAMPFFRRQPRRLRV